MYPPLRPLPRVPACVAAAAVPACILKLLAAPLGGSKAFRLRMSRCLQSQEQSRLDRRLQQRYVRMAWNLAFSNELTGTAASHVTRPLMDGGKALPSAPTHLISMSTFLQRLLLSFFDDVVEPMSFEEGRKLSEHRTLIGEAWFVAFATGML